MENYINVIYIKIYVIFIKILCKGISKMRRTLVNIPKAIFQAQKLVQDARSFDHQDQYKQAIIYYMHATKKFLVLLKQYPQMPFHKQCAQEAQLCLQRVKQLKPSLLKSTKLNNHPETVRINPKIDQEILNYVNVSLDVGSLQILIFHGMMYLVWKKSSTIFRKLF